MFSEKKLFPHYTQATHTSKRLFASGDIVLVKGGAFGGTGAKVCLVAANATTINPGEPVVRTRGAATVTVIGSSTLSAYSAVATKPVVGTDFMAGISVDESTQTASAAGKVTVRPIVPGAIYKIKPLVAATFGVGSTPVQATYDALVGDNVLIDCDASGNFKLLASDSANNGCIIEWKDVTKDTGWVYISFRQALSDTCDSKNSA